MIHKACYRCHRIGHKPDMIYKTAPLGYYHQWFCIECYREILNNFAIKRCEKLNLKKKTK